MADDSTSNDWVFTTLLLVVLFAVPTVWSVSTGESWTICFIWTALIGMILVGIGLVLLLGWVAVQVMAYGIGDWRREKEERAKLTPGVLELQTATAAVCGYRSLGFLAGYADCPEDELAQKFRSTLNQLLESVDISAGEITTYDPEIQTLALLDQDRFWIDDGSLEFKSGQGNYATALQILGRISGARFQPRDISETWKGGAGPIALQFTLENEDQEIELPRGGLGLDVHFIAAINALLPGVGWSFEVISRLDDDGPEDWLICALSREEKKSLKRIGLMFERAENLVVS